MVVSDGPAPRTHDFEQVPGFSNTVVWAMEDFRAPAATPADITPSLASFVAGPGGSRMIFARFAPEATLAGVDPAAARAEQLEALPGLAERFDPNRPGFHTTPSVDHVIVLEGELWLELDTGPETLVRAGDVVIQNGTAHAWHNRGSDAAVIVAVMIGTDQPDSAL
jgi:mannose-6-phosphate isomerase-like protein (cupin superfamily)